MRLKEAINIMCCLQTAYMGKIDQCQTSHVEPLNGTFTWSLPICTSMCIHFCKWNPVLSIFQINNQAYAMSYMALEIMSRLQRQD